jgi:cation diffusion facilitator family transporter
MRYEYKKGKELQSDFLVSDAMHTKADIFTSLSVILTLIAVKAGYPILDPIATIIISIFIAHAGYEIIQQSSRVLCDSAALSEVKKIEEIVLGIKDVLACHKIRTRGRPDDIHADLHVQIDANTRMQDAHQISFVIEERIKKEIPEITDVVVHLEPKEKLKPS